MSRPYASALATALGALGLWFPPSHPAFAAALLVVLLAPWASAAPPPGRPPGRGWLAPLLLAAAALPHCWWPFSAPAAVLALIAVGGAFPCHLWLEGLRRRAAAPAFAVLVLAQPGLALAIHVLGPLTVTIAPGLRLGLTTWFVATAVLQSGLALVRDEPVRALLALVLSQSLLLTAGALASNHGFAAELMMLAGTNLGAAALLLALHEVERCHGPLRLAPDHGLAAVHPALAKGFLVMGWFFVGLPGGVVFFAEDLLFHTLVEHSRGTAAAMVFASVLNAIGFYRIYLGVFCGRPRPDLSQRTTPRRWLPGLLAALTLLTLALGCAPQWLLGQGH